MKVLSNLAGSYLTSDVIADQVITYSDALAVADEVELVDVPVIDGAGARLAPIVMGALTRLTARPAPSALAIHRDAHEALLALTAVWVRPGAGLRLDRG